MSNTDSKLFVGNLPYTTTQEELAEFFGAAGTVVTATIIVNKYTGRSKGYGFVEMTSPKEAAKAKEELNGKELGGRALIVNEAKPEKPRDEMKAESEGEAPAGE